MAAFDSLQESPISLAEAAKLVPGRPHTTTIWRWCRRGHAGIRLDYIRCGRRIYTSREALQRFFSKVTENDPEPSVAAYSRLPARAPRRRPRDRTVQRRRAEALVREAGI